MDQPSRDAVGAVATPVREAHAERLKAQRSALRAVLAQQQPEHLAA